MLLHLRKENSKQEHVCLQSLEEYLGKLKLYGIKDCQIWKMHRVDQMTWSILKIECQRMA